MGSKYGLGCSHKEGCNRADNLVLEDFLQSFLCSGPKLHRAILEAVCMSTCVTLSRKEALGSLTPLILLLPCCWGGGPIAGVISVCLVSSKTGFISVWITGRNCNILIVKTFELLECPKFPPFLKVQGTVWCKVFLYSLVTEIAMLLECFGVNAKKSVCGSLGTQSIWRPYLLKWKVQSRRVWSCDFSEAIGSRRCRK